MNFKAICARDILKAMYTMGWVLDRQTGSHKILRHPGRCARREPNSTYSFSWDIRETMGPPAISKLMAQARLDRETFLKLVA